MNLKKALSPRVIFPELQAQTKDEAIVAMVTLLAQAHGVDDVGPLIEAVRAREAREATGLEYGVAVPHGKTDAVPNLIAGVARLTEGVDFGARDGQPSRILVMTISPQARSGPHLQFLGEVIKILRGAELREQILAAPDANTIYRLMIGT